MNTNPTYLSDIDNLTTTLNVYDYLNTNNNHDTNLQ